MKVTLTENMIHTFGLDPMNAKVILEEMAEHLIENDQENASKYKANLKKAHKDLDKLTKK